MQDQRLTPETDISEVLRDLPREQARTGFTARVLARLDEIDAPSRLSWQPRLAVAFGVLALVAAVGAVRYEKHIQEAKALRAVEALRAEHSQLRRELRELSSAPPVVYLGGNENVDLVMDLRNVQPDGGVQPAAVRYDTF